MYSGYAGPETLMRSVKVIKASAFQDPWKFRSLGKFENDYDRSLALNNPLKVWFTCIKEWHELYIQFGKPARVTGKVATEHMYNRWRDACLKSVSADDAVFRKGIEKMEEIKSKGHWGVEYKAASAPDDVWELLDRFNTALEQGKLPGLKKPLVHAKKIGRAHV